MDFDLSREGILDHRVRYLGVFVAAAWVFNATYNVGVVNKPANMLWMCHVSTALVAIGLLGSFVGVLRATTAWTILGLPIWLVDALTVGTSRVSVLSHVVVPVLAFGALSQCRMVRPLRQTLLGVLLLLGLQAVCRVATPAELNINLAHRPYEGFLRGIVSGHSAYWFLSILLVAAALLALNLSLARLFPAEDDDDVLDDKPAPAAHRARDAPPPARTVSAPPRRVVSGPVPVRADSAPPKSPSPPAAPGGLS